MASRAIFWGTVYVARGDLEKVSMILKQKNSNEDGCRKKKQSQGILGDIMPYFSRDCVLSVRMSPVGRAFGRDPTGRASLFGQLHSLLAGKGPAFFRSAGQVGMGGIFTGIKPRAQSHS